jgi:uncharacterized OB-fold protein
MAESREGVVYTETVVHSATPQFAAHAPYQLAIVALDSGRKVTVRISGDRAEIGDRVLFVEERDGVAYYRKR